MKYFRIAAFAAVGILLGIAAAVGIGASVWKHTTARIVRRSGTAPFRDFHRRETAPAVFSLDGLAQLPVPVARYFRFALTPGQPLIQKARFEQTGVMRTGADAPWSRFRAVEHFSARPVGYVWDASVQSMPPFAVHVRDYYLAGEGASEG